MKAWVLTIAILLVPSARVSADPPSKWLRWATYVTVGCSLTTSATDYGTSMFAFGKGIASEANLWLAPFQHNPVAFGLIKIPVGVVTNGALLKQREAHPVPVFLFSLGTCVTYSWVTNHNAQIIRRAQGNH